MADATHASGINPEARLASVVRPVTVSVAPFPSSATGGVFRTPLEATCRRPVAAGRQGKYHDANPRTVYAQRPAHPGPRVVARPGAEASGPADPRRAGRPRPPRNRRRHLRHAGALRPGPGPAHEPNRRA